MDTKLTLKLDKQIIERAKHYASSQQKSLSRMIEAYLKSILENEKDPSDEIEISPFVRSISTGVSVPSEFDYKKSYQDHLMEKHK